jgi:acetyl-CoA C-acetyltransferase
MLNSTLLRNPTYDPALARSRTGQWRAKGRACPSAASVVAFGLPVKYYTYCVRLDVPSYANGEASFGLPSLRRVLSLGGEREETMEADARIPVIIGVGQVNDRPADPADGLNSQELMASALRAANSDAGSDWLTRLESLAVVAQISCPDLDDISGRLAAGFGARPRHCYQSASASGDSPIKLLNEAANRIADGEISIAAVAGGEALRTAAQRAAAASGKAPSAHNPLRSGPRRREPTYRDRYGLSAPVDVYPLYENAGRAAYGQSLGESQRENGEIWARFSQVAAANPHAWLRRAMTPDEIIAVSPDNRPIAFPYNKLMVANSSVNQGAAFIVASLAEARAKGIADDRLVYVGRGAAAHEPDDILSRDHYDRSASMAVSLRRAMELNEVAVGDLDFVELYSCFPCVPKMARRVIDWPVERPATVFGGLTFGGGPIGNYMSHAVASLTDQLRGGHGTGLLFANGGLATHNHTLILSGRPLPGAGAPCDFDYQAEADAARDRAPSLTEDYVGPGVIESYTVLYRRDGSPRSGVIVGRSPDRRRFLATVPAEHGEIITLLTDGRREPVGMRGATTLGPDGLQIWRPQA